MIYDEQWGVAEDADEALSIANRVVDLIDTSRQESISGSLPTLPDELAQEYVRVARFRKKHVAVLDDLCKKRLALMQGPIWLYMKAGKWPLSGKVDGANLHHKLEVWASPIKNDLNKPDHDQLSVVLEALELFEFLPKTVNSQTMSGYVRDHLHEDDDDDVKAMPIEDRLLHNGFPPELLAVLNITEKDVINANQL